MARITAAVRDALRPGQPLKDAINRLDAELAGKPIDYQSPDEPYERSCPRCLSPSMQPLGNYTVQETEQLKASWALSSRRIKSATTRLVVMAVTLVITASDTLWLAAEPRPSSRPASPRGAGELELGAPDERRWPSGSDERHAATSEAALACSVLTTFDAQPTFFSPIPDT